MAASSRGPPAESGRLPPHAAPPHHDPPRTRPTRTLVTADPSRPLGENTGDAVGRFHRVLAESIAARTPAYLRKSFTVAEIYQSLAPFRSHHERLGITLNREYDELLLRLLAGEGGYLVLESEPARETIRRELERRHRNTGIYREFAAAKVRLNPARIPIDLPDAPSSAARATGEDGTRTGPAGDAARAPARRVAAAGKVRRSRAGPKAAPDTCPACSRKLPDHERLRFCPHCGENTREAPCPKCGEILQREWRFCIACGARALP